MIDYNENDIVVSDEEIQALANLSHKVSAEIIEFKKSGRFNMCLRTKEKIKNTDEINEQILVATNNYDKFKELSTNFFKKFIKYGGNIDLSDVFIDNDN